MIKINSLSSREKNVLYITIAIILFSLVYSLIISPFFNRFKDIRNQTEHKKNQLRTNLQILERAKYLKEWNQKLPIDLKSEELTKLKITQILTYLESISKTSNVELININPGRTLDYPEYQLMHIELTFNSQMVDAVDFLYALESSSLLFSIERMQITSTEEGRSVNVFLEISKLIII